MKYIKKISKLNFFKTIKKDDLEIMISNNSIFIKKYDKNEIIHLQSELCSSMDIVIEGKVIVQNIDENGNIITISNFEKNELFGAHLLFSSQNFYPMTIIAQEETTILKIEKSKILDLCQNNKIFLIEYLNQISDRSNTLASVINRVTRKSIRACIIDFLKFEKNLQDSNKIILNISKKELSEKFGIQRTSLSRELSKMKKDGLIDFDKNSITIINLENI
ncbi:Crp/Fnr family transcriptional regulator [Helicovermis profundi]|uniref:Crp/Fnr family transcriptional regulator n=1 Tax=Helicovermis profundi TaxID=3065157 RepID=A0AAU9ECB4_9FIRM|nr:hypothetical protein HLPR_19230 [Clostridia bacterium S502]